MELHYKNRPCPEIPPERQQANGRCQEPSLGMFLVTTTSPTTAAAPY